MCQTIAIKNQLSLNLKFLSDEFSLSFEIGLREVISDPKTPNISFFVHLIRNDSLQSRQMAKSHKMKKELCNSNSRCGGISVYEYILQHVVLKTINDFNIIKKYFYDYDYDEHFYAFKVNEDTFRCSLSNTMILLQR